MTKLKLSKLGILLPVVLFSCATSSESTPTTSTSTSTTLATPEPVRVAAVGDISCGTSQRKSGDYDCADGQVANAVRDADVDYALLLGDIQYPSHGIGDFYANFLPLWEGAADKMLPIPGNHEYENDIDNNYFAAWGSEFNNGYYTYDLNDDWIVVALDTNDNCEIVSCDESSDQYAWLEQQLVDNSDKCVIAMMHHPRFSSGVHGDTTAVAPMYELMASNKVVIVLSGHDHHYERFYNSPAQFVVGTGGKDLRGASSSDSSFVIDDQHGFLLLNIYDKFVSTSFIDINSNAHDVASYECKK